MARLSIEHLRKTYGEVVRPVAKPVAGSVKVSVNGVEAMSGWSVDLATGVVTFATAPAKGALVRAGFVFDVPVRFDSDRVDLTLEGVDSGRVGAVSLVEIRT